MHKKISAVITIIIFVFLISIMWFFINKKNVNEFLIKNLNIANEFKIQKKFKIESGKEREIILPQFWGELSSSSRDSYEDVTARIYESWDVQSVVLNADNTISVYVTKKQWEKKIKKIQRAINSELKKCKDGGVIVSISKDMKKITYILTKDCNMSMQSWMMSETVFMGNLFEAQAFTGVEPNECKLHEIVQNEKSGEIIVDDVSPGAKYSFTERQWNGTEGRE
ncbi:MAG: hypothetical protein RR681_07890 [Lachnospiraceae bacterium]